MPIEYTLAITAYVTTDGLTVDASYDEGCIDASQLRRMLRQFEHLYLQLLERSRATIAADLDYCSPEDAAELCKWNGNVAAPNNACIHEMISEQAKENPEAEAVCAWDGKMTYRELDAVTARLGSYLYHEANVAPGRIVCYCFEKSIWSIVAILAVLKAGGAVTALDPTWPVQRTADIIAQTESILVLGDEHAAEILATIHPNVLVVDESIETKFHGISMLPVVASADLLFVQFTSGSTGVPKGILIDHGTYASSIAGHAERLCLKQGTRVLQFCNFTYDVSMGEILTTLVVVSSAMATF